ncbi:hypothetical protein MOV08_20605 [Streptomyces yunnanensis]|uniref:Monovalent cation:H+ antiporter, CPA1 family n=1 Tax=Streptomyces yunnanensis TaxID=156453 RepID=A0A9X8MRP2_9ACTN|nr:hypothetical protein [Streptomyces yunnanensis]WEB46131.1 hypothetical protein MOV08_20605 [Streptomyces yunnanensis]SHL57013.1 monovalent cation:H+ antiporter, CPA1 family [Streptomyces yunnanensis]
MRCPGRTDIEARLRQVDDDGEGGTRGPAARFDDAYREIRRSLIAVETAEFQQLYEANKISNSTRRRLQRALDLEEAGLGD